MFGLLLTLLFGCGSPLVGSWEGDCLFSDGNQTEDLFINAQIERDSGYLLDGTLQLIDWNDDQYSASLTGDHSGKYVLLKGDFDTDLGSYRLRLDTQRVGRILEGTCSLQSTEAPGALVGDILLNR